MKPESQVRSRLLDAPRRLLLLRAPSRLLLRAPGHWAAGPLAYAALVVVLAKLARTIELALRFDSLSPFLLLPAALGQDVMLVAAIGLLGHALGGLRRPRLRLVLTLLVLVPLALLLPADVVAHLLTGRPITFQRLRGDEGAGLGDLGLLGGADLIGGLLGIALALLLLWPALAYAAHVDWLKRWSRPRPLLLTLLLGFAASLLQGALLPNTQGLAEQPVFVLLQSLAERSGLQGLALSEQRWRALQQPALPVPAPRAPRVHGPPPKNVVIFLAEGIPFKDTGFNPEFATKRDKRGKTLPNPTPNLVRRQARHGLLFDHYYANWHASIQAIFSIVCSAFPPLSGDIVRIKPRIDCGELSQVMAARGVRSGLFHGGHFNFYNKLALLGRRDYAIELDAEELKRKSARATHEWGIDDRAMTEATVAWASSLPRDQRFAALLIAISAHYPYWVPSDFERVFKNRNRRERFLNAVAFQDQAFEAMLREFERRGLYDDTLFVWLGDHGHYVSEPQRLTPGLRQFYQPNLHSPLVLINSRMFPSSLPQSERTNSRLGSHVDLLPTLLDALGLPADPRHQGQSLLGAEWRPRRVFFGAEDGKFLGFLEDDRKFAVETRTRRTEYYDMASDPNEKLDLSARSPQRMQRYSEDAIAFARGAQARIESAPVLREAASVGNLYELFLEHVAVSWVRETGSVACSQGAKPQCPGLGRVLRLKTTRLQGERRRCVMVKVPPEGSLDLSVTDRDTLELLTGTIVAMPETVTGGPRFKIVAVADGERQNPVILTVAGAVRPGHPRARRELRFGFERTGPKLAKPDEVCLQLTTLVSK